jgi:prophage maintenance system killer protein
LSSAIVEYWADKLEQSPTFDGRPDRDEIQAALERIAHRVLVQRDWAEDRLVAAAGQSA